MKKAMTVLGMVEEDRLGHILPHEHILSDLPEVGNKPLYPELIDRKVEMELLGRLRRDRWSCKDNLSLNEIETALSEVMSFRMKGGGTIVDVTSVGLGRKIRQVADISRYTGVHIIAGTGYYHKAGHPVGLEEQTITEIRDWMITELQEGIEHTEYRAGVIGEIGISSPMHPDEKKVLLAALAAHRVTGAPISIHQYGGKELDEIHAVVEEAHVKPEKVILCHMGSVTSKDRLRVAERGYYVEIDCFGNEYYLDAMAGKIIRDPDRIRMVKELIEKGHLRQILISNDICYKMLWKKYGGWSYEHLLVHIQPFMLRFAIPPKAITTMMYYNPIRAFAYLD